MYVRKAPNLHATRLLAALALGSAAAVASASDEAEETFVVYYASEASPETFEDYDLVVLDATYHPPLPPLAAMDKTLLGYVSLGEVSREREHFAQARRADILLSENPHWEGSFLVDLRSPSWTRLMLEHVIPAILDEGFDGLFLDTLDNAAHLERLDPVRYAGMTRAAAQLVRAIRKEFPGAALMMNRAYEILPEVDVEIDYVLGESVRADYDFDAGVYRLVSDELYRTQVSLLQEARERQPRLRVMTLDYWDPSDAEGLRRIYREQRANGFAPYVATLELDHIVPEPGAPTDPSSPPREGPR